MEHKHEGYGAGHPWYYVLGGKRLELKKIRETVRTSGYRGYLARDIAEADSLAEPKRSQTLRGMREKAKASIGDDIARYRELARALAKQRASGEGASEQPCCSDIHTAISLKHNHITNEFAHLIALEELLSKQGDLFDL